MGNRTAISSEWQLFATENRKSAFYHTQSISPRSSGKVSAWVWRENTMDLYEMNCPLRQFKIRHVVKYDARGNVLWSRPFSSDTEGEIVSGSLEEALFRHICQGKN
jgi:hypothetical protein